MESGVTRRTWLASVAAIVLLDGCASNARPGHLRAVIADQRQSEVAYERGDLPRALAGYEALTKTMPDNEDFWFRLGNIHVRMEQPDLAVDAYRHALKLDPANAKAWHNLGVVRMRQAAAAFAQSSSTAGPQATELGRASAKMAHSLAELVDPVESAPADAAPVDEGREKGAGEGRATP